MNAQNLIGPDKRGVQKNIFLLLHENICSGYSCFLGDIKKKYQYFLSALSGAMASE